MKYAPHSDGLVSEILMNKPSEIYVEKRNSSGRPLSAPFEKGGR